MRILLIVHGFPPHAWGGTELYTAQLARALRRQHDDDQHGDDQHGDDQHGDDQDEVVVLTREAVPERPEYAVRRERTADGVEVVLLNHTFRACRSFEGTYRNAALRRKAAWLLDELRPDVAHIQHLTCLGTDLVAELRRRQVPTFFTLNDYWLICQRGQLFDLDLRPCDGPHRGCRRCADAVAPAVERIAPAWRRLEGRLPAGLAAPLGRFARWAARRTGSAGQASAALERRTAHVRAMARGVTLFLAPSDTLRDRFLDFGLPADRLRRFEQGIDATALDEVRRRRTPAPAGPLRIGFLGSLMVSKAPHVLLEAFAGLPAGAATLELFGSFAPYHGDASYRAVLEPLLALPRVEHPGPVPHAEVPAVLGRLDVLVVPSVWIENAPFVIREAFAAGVPVVASDLGGMAERVADGVNGLLFRPGDAADLRRALRRLCDEPGLLERLRAGLPPTRTIEAAAAELRQLYAAPPPPPPRPRLAAVVLNYRTPRDTLLAVRSLGASRRPLDDLVVVDNASAQGSAGDDSASWLGERLPEGVELIVNPRNLGFAGGTNAGLRRVLERGAERVLLLNGDALVAPDAVERLEEALDADPEAGIVGATLLAAQDPVRIASQGLRFSAWSGRMRQPEAGRLFEPSPSRRVEAVSGCGMLVDRRVFDAAGLLDEDFFFSFEDLEFGLRAARAGFVTRIAGDALIYHQGSRSIGAASPRRLYYAARNHLLAARRGAPTDPLRGGLRALLIVGFNIAHALLGGGSRIERLGAVWRGTRDHVLGRELVDGP